MPGKRSQAELKRIVRESLSRLGLLSRPHLWLEVLQVEVSGYPIDSVRAFAVLHFLASGSPFCCGEPSCHLAIGEDRLEAIGDEIRRALGLRQPVSFAFQPDLRAHYQAEVVFDFGLKPTADA